MSKSEKFKKNKIDGTDNHNGNGIAEAKKNGRNKRRPKKQKETKNKKQKRTKREKKRTAGKMYIKGVFGKDEVIIPIREEIDEDKLTRVGASCGLTINLSNFQSARIGCWVELPCDVRDVDEAFHTAFELVQGKVAEEVDKIKDFRKQMEQQAEMFYTTEGKAKESEIGLA